MIFSKIPSNQKKQDTLVLIDAHALIYRAYFAMPPLTSPEGVLVNAVYGFCLILLNVIDELKPTHIAVAFDMPKPTFRHIKYVGYKAQRKEMPADLQPQIQLVRDIVRALNIPDFGIEGFEADDVIGTISLQVEQNHPEVKTLIVTGDKDSFQLVTEQTHVWMPGTGKRLTVEYDAKKVEEKMGVGPELIVDLKALMGDASDNIPGIKGIGPKTAVRLLKEFGSLEGVYGEICGGSLDVELATPFSTNRDDSTDMNSLLVESSVAYLPKPGSALKGSILKKVVNGYEDAVLSKELATIDRHVPLEFKLLDCLIYEYDSAKAADLFEKLGFRSLIKKLPKDAFEREIAEALF